MGSVLGARVIAQNSRHSSRQVFVASSMEIASTLKLAILHEQDLVVTAGAFAIRNPNGSQVAFLQWTSSVRAFERYPELEGIAELAMVPADQLDRFAAQAVVDPTGPLTDRGTFQVTPPGSRPYYCLKTAAQSRQGLPATPAGTDYCSTDLGSQLLQGRDSGQSTYLPYRSGSSVSLILGTPIYSGSVVPTSIEARRATFVGWTGTEIQPSVVLATALADHPSTWVAFHYTGGTSNVTFAAGSQPQGAQSTTISLHNGWSVQVFGPAAAGGVFAGGSSLAVLLCGLTISLLLGLLIEILGTSRSRAVVLAHKRNDQLHHQAFHDSLTGLPNRALILDRIDQMMARSRRENIPTAALIVDIDNFKEINDSLGHSVGNQVLVKVGSRLATALREGDTVGRIGGDEFVVLVEGASLAAGADVVADRILDVLATPFQIPERGTPLAVAVSIGMATGHRAEAEELLRDADTALDRAKTTGKQRAVTFASSMQDAADSHRSLDLDLRAALEANQFFLMYQPTVDLATGAFTGAEALLRWRHPERGVVQPDAFIPALEATGLIVPVGKWVLEEACRQGVRWQSHGHPLAVSVNIAGAQVDGDGILEDVYGALSSSGFDPAMLILELTETTLMRDVQATVGRLHRLKAIGVRIAIDDFGTGYSSLAYLRQFPIDVLKIDQSFVSGMADTTESAAIVHALVQLGKALGLETIAEGIETNDQRMRLKAEEVDNGQGFLFARPLDVESVDQLLRDSVDTRTASISAR
jgi:diguanylate cyclase (GGDEF)-like protein